MDESLPLLLQKPEACCNAFVLLGQLVMVFLFQGVVLEVSVVLTPNFLFLFSGKCFLELLCLLLRVLSCLSCLLDFLLEGNLSHLVQVSFANFSKFAFGFGLGFSKLAFPRLLFQAASLCFSKLLHMFFHYLFWWHSVYH